MRAIKLITSVPMRKQSYKIDVRDISIKRVFCNLYFLAARRYINLLIARVGQQSKYTDNIALRLVERRALRQRHFSRPNLPQADNIHSGETIFMARIPWSRAVRKACTRTYIFVLFPRRSKSARPQSGDTCRPPVVFIRAYLFLGNSNLRWYTDGSRLHPHVQRERESVSPGINCFPRDSRGRAPFSANKENAVGCEAEGRARDRVHDRSRGAATEDIRGYNSRRTVLIAEYKDSLSGIPSIP